MGHRLEPVNGPWLKLARPDRCPVCGRHPPLSFHASEKDARSEDRPEKPIHTVRCKCGHVYVVTAGAILRARPWVDRDWRDS